MWNHPELTHHLFKQLMFKTLIYDHFCYVALGMDDSEMKQGSIDLQTAGVYRILKDCPNFGHCYSFYCSCNHTYHVRCDERKANGEDHFPGSGPGHVLDSSPVTTDDTIPKKPSLW